MARAIKHIRAGLLHVEVIGSVPEHEPGRRRAGRCRPTSAAQQFYNNKCSWRELELLLAANFAARDWVLTLTYDDQHLPPDRQAAARCFQSFVRKWRAARKRRSQELRYIYVTEGWHGKSEDEWFGDDGRLEDRRLHHHVVVNRAAAGCRDGRWAQPNDVPPMTSLGPEDLEEIRSLWQYGGYVRAEPVDVHYYRELAKYLTKEAREFGRARPGERTWRASRNLKKYEVEYIDIPSDSVTLSAPPGAVDYVQFTERNPFGFADCIGARYLLFEAEVPPGYSYTRGRKPKRPNNF